MVHHTKKGSENDVYDEINGSAGIQSNMDSMIVLASSRKAGKNSVFHCIPKDAEQLEFEIAMNENMIWEDIIQREDPMQYVIKSIECMNNTQGDGATISIVKVVPASIIMHGNLKRLYAATIPNHRSMPKIDGSL